MLTRFVTTTVAAEATLRPPSPSSNQPIVPVAAIVGGVVGGALLAVLVTAGWIWWGKLIKRKQLADRLENESQIRTLRNTRHNISQSPAPHQPFTGHTVPHSKIRFANTQNSNEDVLPSLVTVAGQLPLSRTKPDRDSTERATILETSSPVSARPSVNSFNSTYTTASEEMHSEQSYPRKKGWQGNQLCDLHRQSISTYATALSELIDDV
ncbi:hypothetical protein JOM56_003812 [Amanita muscaria]